MDDQALQHWIQYAASGSETPSSDGVERFIDEFHRRQLLVTMKSSAWETLKEKFTEFFSHSPLSVVAYATATIVAVVFSLSILDSPRWNDRRGIATNPLLSEESVMPLSYYSPYLQQSIEPVTFDLKKKRELNNLVVYPLSYILKRKSSPSLKEF
jgi:hypothetical protein